LMRFVLGKATDICLEDGACDNGRQSQDGHRGHRGNRQREEMVKK
jgi:hypothetical protein